MATVRFQNVSRLLIHQQLHKLPFHPPHRLSPSPSHHHPFHYDIGRLSVRYFCSLRSNAASTSHSKSNKHRSLSYHSYLMPKPVHLREGKKATISNSLGFGGEDSFFTTKSEEQLFIGVADGVGSWKPQKAKDAARYSKELMRGGIEYLNSKHHSNHSIIPQKMAHFAWNRVTKTMQLDGASTLCMLQIGALRDNDHDDNDVDRESVRCRLDAFNLGDSGFCVYRSLGVEEGLSSDSSHGHGRYEVIYKSPAQEQGFGIPYQLGSHPTSNRVDDGQCIQRLLLRSLDIVVVGSDGLWDNLWDHEVAQIIADSMTNYHRQWTQKEDLRKGEDLSFCNFVHRHIVSGGLTHKIMKEAYLSSIDRKKSTPWSVAMTDTVDMVYNGGKPDDITCIVCFIH